MFPWLFLFASVPGYSREKRKSRRRADWVGLMTMMYLGTSLRWDEYDLMGDGCKVPFIYLFIFC